MGRWFLTVLILFCLAVPAAGNSFVRLADDHWAYEAVSDVAALEEFSVEPLSLSANRYDAAVAVAEVIQELDVSEDRPIQRFGISRDVDLEHLVTSYELRFRDGEPLPTEAVKSIFRLAAEFSRELEVLGYSLRDNHQAVMMDSPALQRAEEVFRFERELVYAADSAEVDSREAAPVQDRSLWITGYPAVGTRNLVLSGGLSRDDVTLPAETVSGVERDNWLERERAEVSTALGGQVPLTSDLLLEASFQRRDDADDSDGVAGIGGQYFLTPDVSLKGRYLHGTERDLGSGAMQLGATVKLGAFEVGGSVQTMQPGFRPLDSEEAVDGGAGYVLSVRHGDLSVSAGREELRLDEAGETRLTTTSLDFTYGLPNDIRLSGGYRQVDSELKTLAELGTPTSTSLGLDIPIPHGRLRFGMTAESLYQEVFADGSISGTSALNEDGRAEAITRKTAEVGLSYLLGSETSLQLNYKLIDFNSFDDPDKEQKSNVATAEFSVRF